MKIYLLILIQILFAVTALANRRSKDPSGIALGIGYSPSYFVSLSGTGTSGGSFYFVSYNLEYQSALSIQVEYRDLGEDSWGLATGLQYEPARMLTKANTNGVNVPVNSSTSTKFQTTFLFFEAAYRWQSFYLPFGLTYGITNTTSNQSSTAQTTASSGVGAILGLGWYITDGLIVEYVGRSAVTGTETRQGSDHESTTGVVSSSLLSVKYLF